MEEQMLPIDELQQLISSLSLSPITNSLAFTTYMTGHPGLPTDVDDQLNGGEFHRGRPRVEEGLVLTRVANLLQTATGTK